MIEMSVGDDLDIYNEEEEFCNYCGKFHKPHDNCIPFDFDDDEIEIEIEK